MPRQTPTISWQQLRNIMEQWQWQDPRTGLTVTGFNPPDKAAGRQQRPFFVRYITGKGIVEEGECVCLKVYPREHQRMVKFTQSNQIRRLRDYLVISVNGFRVVTH